MKELQFQSEIVKDIRAAGGFALKLAHKMIVGVPDLLVKLPGMPAMLIECKAEALPVKADTPISIAVTPLQERALTDFGTARGVAGVLLFSQIGRMKLCLALPFPAPKSVQKGAFNRYGFTKYPGEKWEVEPMLRRLTEAMPL